MFVIEYVTIITNTNMRLHDILIGYFNIPIKNANMT